jgi:hypothetical protein
VADQRISGCHSASDSQTRQHRPADEVPRFRWGLSCLQVGLKAEPTAPPLLNGRFVRLAAHDDREPGEKQTTPAVGQLPSP